MSDNRGVRGNTHPSRWPSFDAVLGELKNIRAKGAGRIRSLSTPTLRQITELMEMWSPESNSPQPILALLRSTIDQFDDSTDARALEIVLGTSPGLGTMQGGERRRRAARQFGVSPDTFRKSYEPALLEQLTEALLQRCYEHVNRNGGDGAPSTLHALPVTADPVRLAQFQTYNRLKLAAEELSTALQVVASFEVAGDECATWEPHTWTYTERLSVQLRRALDEALWAYGRFLEEKEAFHRNQGELWIVSDRATETALAAALHTLSTITELDELQKARLRRSVRGLGTESTCLSEWRQELAGPIAEAWDFIRQQRPDESKTTVTVLEEQATLVSTVITREWQHASSRLCD